ncbi:MAG TPA: P-type conjugative transfer protein TrbG [Noviherbaspirillum sp.]|nr:P-type conjugative transfer protein TrbG [Noviherbaspirillum sp.]
MGKTLRYCAMATLMVVSGLTGAAEKYNVLEDAAVSQARVWQSGGKARPIMSSDGMVIFPFGQSMPRLTCSPTRACDVQMQPNEKVRKVILGDGVNWTWQPADSMEQGKSVQHVVFQPRDNNLESNVIITTDRRTYHIKLYSPKQEGVYLNRVGFYYPEELVQSWEEKAGTDAVAETKAQSASVMPLAVAPERLAFDYRIDGDAAFKPVRVFSDGERVYLEMPDSLKSGTYPVLLLVDGQNKQMVTTYRRVEDPETGKVHFVVDRLFDKAVLLVDPEKVTITWKRKEKWSWAGGKP